VTFGEEGDQNLLNDLVLANDDLLDLRGDFGFLSAHLFHLGKIGVG